MTIPLQIIIKNVYCVLCDPPQLDIAASVPGSRISLNMSSEGEDDDDDFNTAISMVTGTPLKGNAKLQQSKSFDLSMSLLQ